VLPLPRTASIGATEGCIPISAIGARGWTRQTAVDLSALVRAIRDTTGLGLNLNRARIHYAGQFFGSITERCCDPEPNIVARRNIKRRRRHAGGRACLSPSPGSLEARIQALSRLLW
jgi:hypothetical protein